MINQEIKEALIESGRDNDIEGVMNGLTELGIRGTPNKLTSVFRKFRDLGHSIFYFDNSEESLEYKGIMTSLLVNSLYNNNVELCDYLLESKELRINSSVHEQVVWIHSVNSGNIDGIKCLVKSTKIDNRTKAKFLLNALGSYSTQENYLEILQYILSDQTMLIRKEVDQEFKNIYGVGEDIITYDIFVNSCRKNNSSAINFLLADPQFSKMFSFMSFYRGLLAACEENRLEIVEFLLHDKKIPFKLDTDYDLKTLLKPATKGGANDVLMYLIFDLNMPKPDNLDELLSLQNLEVTYFTSFHSSQLNVKKVMETRDFVNKLFEKRELIEGLNSSLNINLTKNRLTRKI